MRKFREELGKWQAQKQTNLVKAVHLKSGDGYEV
jgi:hypothetical protein